MQIIARTISAVLSVYMILLIIRVMLTWFRTAQNHQVFHYLAAITDPYLNWFRRFQALRFGMIDFSPIIAFVVLGFVINISSSIATYGKITVGFFLALLVNGIWSIISFILVLLIILTIIRLVGATFAKGGFIAQMSPGIDSIIEPLTSWVRRTIFRNRFTPYTTQLGIALAILIVLNIAGRFLFGYLTNLAAGLPF
ncbi:MAG: YggT family protein [Spirochaetales bacterium]|uniref:YggT family protein n=1 Tax=Candidatus Thalassospirochaeta sargassi TaxID=3119039 RepID=A0AAJ1MK53_9SPIO|nr:YggT family protein [Spirochaetales bacterium]